MRLDNEQMKTLKSQLRLRPSYNELIKEITKEEYKNKNIRDVIDRNAYYFRDSPLGTVYDNNTVDLRQQRFQKMLDGKNQTEHFDISRDDEMDDLRDEAIQSLSASMDDAEEQHERQISQVSKRVSSEQIADLHQRAQRARQLEGQEGRRPSIQSMVTAKSSDTEDLPPLEPLMTEDEAVKRIQGAQRGLTTRKEDEAVKRIQRAQRGLMMRKEERREQARDNADTSSTVPQRQSRTHKETIDYSTDMKHWNQKTNVLEKDLLFQLHLRGIELTKEQQHEYENETQKKGGKGKKETGRAYLVGLIEKLIQEGKWTTRVNDELLRKRMGDWRVMKGKGKASESVPTQEEKTQKEKREAQLKELEDKFPLNDYSQVDLTNISFTDMTALFSYAINIKSRFQKKQQTSINN